MSFLAKIQALYGGIECILKFNGNLSAPFRACRGVRQGCALSGILYALSLEPLLCKIILSAYADDVVVNDFNILEYRGS